MKTTRLSAKLNALLAAVLCTLPLAALPARAQDPNRADPGMTNTPAPP